MLLSHPFLVLLMKDHIVLDWDLKLECSREWTAESTSQARFFPYLKENNRLQMEVLGRLLSCQRAGTVLCLADMDQSAVLGLLYPVVTPKYNLIVTWSKACPVEQVVWRWIKNAPWYLEQEVHSLWNLLVGDLGVWLCDRHLLSVVFFFSCH